MPARLQEQLSVAETAFSCRNSFQLQKQLSVVGAAFNCGSGFQPRYRELQTQKFKRNAGYNNRHRTVGADLIRDIK